MAASSQDLSLEEYRALAEFRTQIRRFLHFSEQSARANGIEHGSDRDKIPDMLFARMKAQDVAYDPTLTALEGFSATINELIMSAEYILNEGNMNVLLCERGIRTFENTTRYTLDLNAVPILKARTHLPIVVDPTHAIGLREFVPQMSLAALAAGADALMIEVHDSPELAKSDGAQALTPDIFEELVPRLRAVAEAVGRRL